jgi:ABC-type metal ion transport system substrate-binding protein
MIKLCVYIYIEHTHKLKELHKKKNHEEVNNNFRAVGRWLQVLQQQGLYQPDCITQFILISIMSTICQK